MKIINLLSNLASLSFIFGQEIVNGTKPHRINFDHAGIENAFHVAIQLAPADGPKVLLDLFDFLRRHPDLKETVLSEVGSKRNTVARRKYIKYLINTFVQNSRINNHEIGVDLVNYAYKEPVYLELMGNIISRLIKDYPSIAFDGLKDVAAVVKKHPELIPLSRDHLIIVNRYAKDDYINGIGNIMKALRSNPDFSAEFFIGMLKIDQLAYYGVQEKGGYNCGALDMSGHGHGHGTPGSVPNADYEGEKLASFKLSPILEAIAGTHVKSTGHGFH